MAVMIEQTEEAAAPPRARLALRSSPALEIVWVSYLHDDEGAYPARERFFDAATGLAERMTEVWGDEACFTELAVLANQAGVLFVDDVEALWAGVERVAAAEPRHEALDSEQPDEKALIRSRIARLHEDPALRARWMETLRAVWAAIAQGWESEGRGYVEAAQCDLGSKLGERVAWSDLEPYIHKDWGGLLQHLFESAAATDLEVTLVPAWLGRMNLMLSFSDRLIICPVLAEPPLSPTAATRNRARRMKALGDPTRLAIFEAVARRPRTVGELARQLRVAQPTVSNHVRLLRDAGLLKEDKDQARRLTADLEAVDRLLEEVRRASAPGC